MIDSREESPLDTAFRHRIIQDIQNAGVMEYPLPPGSIYQVEIDFSSRHIFIHYCIRQGVYHYMQTPPVWMREMDEKDDYLLTNVSKSQGVTWRWVW